MKKVLISNVKGPNFYFPCIEIGELKLDAKRTVSQFYFFGGYIYSYIFLNSFFLEDSL